MGAGYTNKVKADISLMLVTFEMFISDQGAAEGSRLSPS